MNKHLVSIVIVNYNGKDLLKDCLSSISLQTYSPIETILIDNGSADGSLEFVRDNFKDVIVIPQNKNFGFAAANNRAIKQAKGEYIATFNNDAIADKEWLCELVKIMDTNDSIGICASKILFYPNHNVVNSTGIGIDKISGFTWDIGFGLKNDNNNETQPKDVFGACAAAALYRKKMLDEIGLFDEDFVSYHEDVDLAWRAQLAGWKCKYVSSAIAYHRFSATAGVSSPLKEYLSNRNKIWMIVKNYPSPEIYRYLLYILLAIFGYLVYSLFTGNIPAVRGKIDAICGVRKFLDKRKIIQKNKKISFSELTQSWEERGLIESFFKFISFRKTLKNVCLHGSLK